MKRRLALKAVDVEMALPIVERLVELGPPAADELPPSPTSGSRFLTVTKRGGPAEMLYEDGSTFAYTMLEYAHGEADELIVGAMPSATELRDWQVRANFAAAAVNRHDPAFMASFISGLSSKDQRLVRSMIKNGDLRVQRGR